MDIYIHAKFAISQLFVLMIQCKLFISFYNNIDPESIYLIQVGEYNGSTEIRVKRQTLNKETD